MLCCLQHEVRTKELSFKKKKLPVNSTSDTFQRKSKNFDLLCWFTLKLPKMNLRINIKILIFYLMFASFLLWFLVFKFWIWFRWFRFWLFTKTEVIFWTWNEFFWGYYLFWKQFNENIWVGIVVILLNWRLFKLMNRLIFHILRFCY